MNGHLDPSAAARLAKGRVSPDEEARLRAHLEICAECAQRVAERPHEAEAITASQPMKVFPATGPFEGRASGEKRGPLDRGTTLGRYLVLNTLGQGGMGVVYAAYDPELDRKVAVKVLRPGRKLHRSPAEGQARLLREAQAMARISHPNVISVYDVGTLEDQVFVAMEFIDGPTLRNWVKQRQRGWREILDVFLQAGAGLEAAHAAGLVHRDFKPENVLVAPDARAYVTDFGLARLVEGETEPTADDVKAVRQGQRAAPDDESGGRLRRDVTQDGVLMGTPQYMAPEQHLGLPPDARSDQFSFCAALYWALYRRRPFDPERLSQAAADADSESPTQPLTPRDARTSASRLGNIRELGRGVIQEPPRDVKVPAWVRRTVLRGLELDPGGRFESMSALLAQLRHDPWKARRRAGVVAAGAMALGISVLAYQQGRTEQQQLCSGADRRIATVWSPQQQGELERAFLGTGKMFARDAAARVSALLDGYTASWAGQHREACEATRLRGEQTEQVLSLRMICLDRRLQDVGALTELFAAADAKVVEKAVDATSALPALSRCADLEALTEQVRLPEDPAKRAEIQAVGAELSKTKTLLDAGRYKEGLERARQSTSRAEATGHAPLIAEALALQGWLEDRSGDAKSAAGTLERAFRTAEVGRDDVTKVIVASRLVYSSGYSRGDLEDANLWGRLARASLERLGRQEDLEVDLLTNVGAVRVLEGRYGEALEAYGTALRLAERTLGKEHPKRALLLTSLGITQTRSGALAEAKASLLESLQIIQTTKGADHPSAAYPHSNLAELLKREGDFPGAHFHVQKALGIWEATLGPQHPSVAEVIDSLASILQAQARHVESVDQYSRALAIKERALGADHPDLAYSLEGMGYSLLELGRANEAIAALERALGVRLAADSGAAAEETRFILARALWQAGRERDRARALATQARDGARRSGDEALAKRVSEWIATARPR